MAARNQRQQYCKFPVSWRQLRLEHMTTHLHDNDESAALGGGLDTNDNSDVEHLDKASLLKWST
jgi:hypothetical protein